MVGSRAQFRNRKNSCSLHSEGILRGEAEKGLFGPCAVSFASTVWVVVCR